MSEGETVIDPLATTPMPKSCSKFPCRLDPGKALLVNDGGFLVCPLCRGSYGEAQGVQWYDALCLMEPWLELILCGYKTLETRTKCLRKKSGPVVLAASKGFDASHEAWLAGKKLTAAEMQRARDGQGKLRGFVPEMGGFVPGVPGRDDAAACIGIALGGNHSRFVASVKDVKRIQEVPSVRLQVKDGQEQIVQGAAQGFYRVPADRVVFL